MQHKGTVLLTSERLILRRFRPDDSEAAFQNWTGDARVTEFLRWPTHASVAVTAKVIQAWVEAYAQDNFYQWAIVLKNSGDRPVGTIGVVDQNERLGVLNIGYCIGSKWWNRGIASEALAAIIPFFFEQVKANRIEAQHDPDNPGSGKVMLKCGLKFEGVLRQADFSNKGIVDAAMYSLLAREYYAGGEADEKSDIIRPR